MSREQFNGEDSEGETGTNRFVDATTELHLPVEPDQIREDVPIYPGAVDLNAGNPNLETQRQFAPPNGAKTKWPRHGLPLPRTPEPCRKVLGAGARPVGSGDGRRKFGMSNTSYPGLAQRRPNAGIQQTKLTPDRFTFGLPTPVLLSPDRQLPGVGTQFEFDQFKDGLPNMTGPGLQNRTPVNSGDDEQTDMSLELSRFQPLNHPTSLVHIGDSQVVWSRHRTMRRRLWLWPFRRC